MLYFRVRDGEPVVDERATTPNSVADCDCLGAPAIAVAPDGSAHIAFSGFSAGEGTQAYYVTDQQVVPDGIDSNCDGVDGIDFDGDGMASVTSGGSDCNDTSPEPDDSASCEMCVMTDLRCPAAW